MSLTDAKIRTLKPSDKPFKVSDSHGLYLRVKPGGSRHWYLKYRISGKESRIALGTYPAISLSDARQQREGIRKMLALNINPVQQRAAVRGSRTPEKVFKNVALAWHKSNRKWSQNTADRLLASLNNHIFPVIGNLPVSELKPRHFIDLLKGIEEKDLLEVASRTRQHLSNIMRHAVHQELIDTNPAANLGGVTTPPVRRHYPALPLERLPELLERIGAYHQGRELTRHAVLLMLHVFIRSSELRFARWSEIDFTNRVWTIPATREPIIGVRYSGRGAKMRMPHIVPLSEQSIAILKQIKDITGNNELIFPGDHNPYKPMCENTVNKALRVMGYDTKKDICGHGFRAMACSALMESGLWAKDAVERQMSHQERNTVRMAYIHKAEHLEARKTMMQWWSDYLEACRESYAPPYTIGKNKFIP
ncbi:integrase arm-type DNA-binding domain-containing protein [Escherichia coli]|uniref:Integrase arm-type DNA-binding domain-containing protein n=1 Tax=Escherichia coli TaxID=562 RepID=A0A8T6QEH6_ECOLX|nr:integrase arm-type DNA-binding domain-containing protein [Escherichia coli]EES4392236.1 integrase arm-type DNA-binding domain-containing protein [Escherichia coli]EFA6786550.1 integrase arm-type DNA-binding domain-containing protein [Escherichia coli]EFJ9807825.1 integrase arm-type DNA-binding domain-containing protein [Escherichia coli]EFK0623134.1 integrase arm-type DNA-binding domain-containing protein [Escherichia coli]EFK2014497.1 integrase arm-type DNA-binding domain-containing protei